MGKLLTPDLVHAQRFLHALDPSGIFTFQTFDDSKQRKDPKLNRVRHGTLEEHHTEFEKLQQSGAGIFVMVNQGDGITQSGKSTCRSAANVVKVRALFADLDGAPLEPTLQDLHPDIVVESSPGKWHVYWLTNDCPLEQFGPRQKQIAKKYGGDIAVNDLPRVMRVPGFFHQKAEPFMTRMTIPE